MSDYVPSSVVADGKSIRRLRFFLLERIVLPLASVPLRLWMWSWRRRGPDPALLADVATWPRVIVTIFHSSLVEAFGFTDMWRPYGRRWIVLTTPSRDGRLAAAMLARFGVYSAPLVEGARGTAAAREFIERVAAGDIGVILVDGPRGPCGAVKAGVARTIAAARARVIAAGLASAPATRVNSWDRSWIPAPFARARATFRPLPADVAPEAVDTAMLQAEMDEAAREAADAVSRKTDPHRGALPGAAANDVESRHAAGG